MSDTSPILSLPYIQPSQAQKHVTHNEAIRTLDTLVQLTAIAADRTDPPAAAAEGDRYIVPNGATGAWAGHAGKIAQSESGSWVFIEAAAGWRCFVLATNELVAFDGSAWASVSGGLSADDLANLPGVGINTTADETNRLAVAADATLLSHAGRGHQLKLNKNNPSDTASLLMQSAWTGYAEMGLAGSNDFEIKVSDGASWFTAMAIDHQNGTVAFPSGGVRPQLTGDLTVLVDPLAGDDQNDGITAPYATIARGLQHVMGVDAGGHAVRLQLADGTYTLTGPLVVNQVVPGAEEIEVIGNLTDPAAVVINGASDLFAVSAGRLRLQGMTLETSGGHCITVRDGAMISYQNMRFDASSGAHVQLDRGHCTVTGDCEIAGNADSHISLRHMSSLQVSNAQITLTNTPAFTSQFLGSFTNSLAEFSGVTFTGTAAGKRYDSWAGSVINTGGQGAAYLPGDTAGTESAGGIYL